MTDTVAALVHAVLRDPEDHTTQLVLADALDEQHHRGQDGRAAVLRRIVAHHNDPFAPSSQLDSQSRLIGSNDGPTGSHFFLRLGRDNLNSDRPRFVLHLGGNYIGGVAVDHSEARDIVDGLPQKDVAHFHNYLDQEFGPRPQTADHYAAAYRNAQR